MKRMVYTLSTVTSQPRLAARRLPIVPRVRQARILRIRREALPVEQPAPMLAQLPLEPVIRDWLREAVRGAAVLRAVALLENV